MAVDASVSRTFPQIPIFRGFSEEECRQFAEIASTAEFQPGDVVIQQSQSGNDLLIVLEGRCKVVARCGLAESETGTIDLAELEPYDQFGEMSFFQPTPRSATVLAKSRLKLLTIRRADFDRLVAAGSPAAYKLAFNTIASLSRRLSRMDEWVAELLRDSPPAQQTPEWNLLREKVFEGWLL